MSKRVIRLRVNGDRVEAAVEERKTLADFLREELELTGTKLGCEHGACGACTVTLDGVAVRSCLVLAVQGQDREVETIEGVAGPDGLDRVQRALIEHHGLQCGFCTPGYVMSIRAFLAETPNPTDDEIRDAMTGNLCRCTGYQGIFEAIRELAQEQQAS